MNHSKPTTTLLWPVSQRSLDDTAALGSRLGASMQSGSAACSAALADDNTADGVLHVAHHHAHAYARTRRC